MPSVRPMSILKNNTHFALNKSDMLIAGLDYVLGDGKIGTILSVTTHPANDAYCYVKLKLADREVKSIYYCGKHNDSTNALNIVSRALPAFVISGVKKGLHTLAKREKELSKL